MKWFKRILVALVALVALLVAVAYLLPRVTEVERSVHIDAAPEVVFPLVNSLQAGAAWSPWLARDPGVQITYSGPQAGVGARSQWQSEHPQVGSGSQEITESVENARVAMALDFGSQGTAEAYFTLAPADGGTDVTWGFATDAGMNPAARWVGLMIERYVGADYEQGLANLKALAEGG